MRTFTIGDIHGRHTELVEVLKLVNFDYKVDHLIQLGDITDRGPDSFLCVEELLKIKNLTPIIGNHCEMFRDFLLGDINVLAHGLQETVLSYCRHLELHLPSVLDNKELLRDAISYYDEDHYDFITLKHPRKYYHVQDSKMFVHGGFNRHEYVEHQESLVFSWDRDLWFSALSFSEMDPMHVNPKFKIKDDFEEVFIGHTPTINWKYPNKKILGPPNVSTGPITNPMKAANIYNIDTGAGFAKGKLTIMDVNTKEYWQVDIK